MKIISLFLLATLNTAFGSEQYFCGTKNQWREGQKNGWYIELDFKNNDASVTKMESPSIHRRYGYKMQNNYGTEIILSSDYGDEITLLADSEIDQKYSANYRNNEESDEFVIECFESNAVKPLPLNQWKINPNLNVVKIVKEQIKMDGHENKMDFIFKMNTLDIIPFPILAQKIQYTISDIGDWEDTILSDSQVQKVITTLSQDINEKTEFNKLTDLIASDMTKDKGLKQMGLLFGRDWYSGQGTVAFVLSKGKQFFVITYHFNNAVKFNDERLDYIY
jgi:hypothetical protein